jgi:hypothetical protein
MMEKPTVVSSFFGTFSSDHICKVMKDVRAHFFIRSFTYRVERIMDSALAVTNTCQLYQGFPGIF